MSDIKIDRENLAEIINFLSDEKSLSDSAISELNFIIVNILGLIKDKSKYEKKVFLYHLECSMVNLYGYLRQNANYNKYTNQVNSCIEKPINEYDQKGIEELLKSIMNSEFPNFDKRIVIMNK